MFSLKGSNGVKKYLFKKITVPYYCVSALLAHNGFVFDFPLLFAEVDRRYPLLTNKLFSHICFGDTLANLRTVSNKHTTSYIYVSVGNGLKSIWVLF